MLVRSIPPTVWALLVLFVLLPGVLPGAVALGIYSAGVLTRLFADALETMPRAPTTHLRAAGAGPVAATAYATAAQVSPTFTSLSLYRLEVAGRESVVVGIVGAGGLGRLLSAQTNAFAFAAMTSTLITMMAMTIVVDLAARSARTALR